MPVKALRALTNPSDGTIYATRGTVLPDDDPIAKMYPNQVCSVNEEIEGDLVLEFPEAAPVAPRPEPEPEEPALDEPLQEDPEDEDAVFPWSDREEEEGVDL